MKNENFDTDGRNCKQFCKHVQLNKYASSSTRELRCFKYWGNYLNELNVCFVLFQDHLQHIMGIKQH